MQKQKFKVFTSVVSAFLVFSSAAYGISRIGNPSALYPNTEASSFILKPFNAHFVAPLFAGAPAFFETESREERIAIIPVRSLLGFGATHLPLEAVYSALQKIYPDYGFSEISESAKCARSFVGQNSKGTLGFSLWPNGNGLVFASELSAASHEAIQVLLEDMEIGRRPLHGRAHLNSTEVNISQFQCYRAFLNAFVQAKKLLRKGYSFRRLSALSGIRSPNFLADVLAARKNMSIDVATRVAAAIRLTDSEKDYFLALVDLANSASEEQRQQAQVRAERALKNLVTLSLPEEEVNTILSQWYHLALRELVFLPDFSPDGRWLASQLRFAITPEQANNSLRLLLRHGFLTVDSTGKYHAADPVLDTGNEHASMAMKRAHTDVLKYWAHLLPQLKSEEHELGLLNIPIAHRKIPELRERIRAFQDELIGWLQSETHPETLVQVGCYFFKNWVAGKHSEL